MLCRKGETLCAALPDSLCCYTSEAAADPDLPAGLQARQHKVPLHLSCISLICSLLRVNPLQCAALSTLQARANKVPLRVSCISPGMVETEFDFVSNYHDQQLGGKRYEQMKCLEAEDIAQAVVYCLAAPDRVEVNDVLMRPTAQST